MKDYRNDYQIREWKSLGELALLLNSLTNEGWLVETHQLSKDSYTGWTIFRRTVDLQKPLLERSINVGRVYSLLNTYVEPGSEQSRAFDAAIKESVRVTGDEF